MTRITEAMAERMADRMVEQRLAGDRIYRNAPCAAAMSEREDEIERQAWEDLTAKYDIGEEER